MSPLPIEMLATILFGVAILHTFTVKRFENLAHRFPDGSIGENTFHLLGEVEAVFGLWATIFLVAFGFMLGSDQAIAYLESSFVIPGTSETVGIHFTEPLFVFAIMVIAATRPILELVSRVISFIARLIPASPDAAFFISALIVGPLLGSFITEPAAMTVTALLLKQRFYDRGISDRLKYATIGLLFVNISIGGTLTHFAAPPVVMIANKWQFDMSYMLLHFGWKAALAILLSTLTVAYLFRRELAALSQKPAATSVATSPRPAPAWLTVLHVLFITGLVLTSHHMAAFMGIFLFFLGVASVTDEYQDELKIRESLLVAYFLMGLVVLGGLQKWWLQPVLSHLDAYPLYFGATGLTAITDNAALTFLGSQVDGLSEFSKYMLVSGAVAGGGLTVIANAPNPAGYGILKASFGDGGVSPLKLFLNALPWTIIATLAFLLLPSF